MTHPLTDEMCNELSVYPLEELGDEYADGTMTDMRAAADWQLRKAIWWLHWNLLAEMPPEERDLLLKDFRAAMRPQEDS